MKNIFLLVVFLFSSSCFDVNSVSAENDFSPIAVEVVSGGYVNLGVLTTVYADAKINSFTVTVPKPNEQVLSCAPNFAWTDLGSTLVITGNLDDIGLLNRPLGTVAHFEIGVRMNNGQIGVYQVKVIAR